MTTQTNTATFAVTVDGSTILTGASFEAAGQAYAKALSDGKNAKLQPEGTPAAAPVNGSAAPAAAPAAAPTQGGTVSQVAVQRIARQEAQAEANGFALPPPIYAAGTRVIDLGDKNFATMRQDVDKLPLFGDASEEVCVRIRDENRRSQHVPLADLRLGADGHLRRESRPDKKGALIEPRAFSALCARGGFGRGAAYLRDHCDPTLRAHNVNEQFKGIGDDDKLAQMRVRKGPSGWSAFAVVSPSYTPFDIDRVLTEAAPMLSDARTEIVYDAETCSVRADAFWMPNEVTDLAAGDVFKAGIRMRSSDDGSGSIVVDAVLFRNLCLNLIIIGSAKVETVRRRHVGKEETIRDALRDGIVEARSRIADFLGDWKHARTLKVNAQEELTRVSELLIGDVVPKNLSATVEAGLAMAWRKEPGNTVADISNAITRAAHEGNFPQASRDALEAYGASYVRKQVKQLVNA